MGKKAAPGEKKKGFFSKLLKFFLISFLSLVLLVGALVAAYSIIGPQFIIEKISTVLFENYSREISVESFELSLIEGIRVQGIALSESGGFDEGTAVEFEEGSVLYNPLGLLRGHLDIVKVSMGGFSTSYQQIISITEDFVSESPEEIEEEETSSKSPLKIKIGTIELYDSTFDYEGVVLELYAKITAKDDLEKTEADIKITSDSGNITMKGNLSYATIAVYGLKLADFVPGVDAVLTSLRLGFSMDEDQNLTLTGRDVDLVYGDFNISVDSGFTGTFHSSARKIFLSNLTVGIEGASLKLSTAEYALQNGKLSADVSEINATLSSFVDGLKGKVSGSVRLTMLGEDLSFDGDVFVSELKYAPVLSSGEIHLQLSGEGFTADGNLTTDGGELDLDLYSSHLIEGPYSASLSADEIDIEKLLDSLSKMESSETGSPDEECETESSSGELPTVSFDLDVSAASYGDLDISDIELSGGIRKSRIVIDNLSLEVLRGTLSASGSLCGSVFSGDLSYSKGKLRDLTTAFFDDDKKLYGTLSAFSTFKLDLADFLDSTAELDITFSDGELRNFILQEEISKVLYDVPLDDIFFDSITLSAKLQNRNAFINEFTFKSDSISVSADGIIELDGMDLDVSALLSIHEDFLSGLPNVTKIFTAGYKEDENYHFLIEVGGNTGDPKVSLN